jgi:hypothetical protein
LKNTKPDKKKEEKTFIKKDKRRETEREREKERKCE